MMNYIKRLIILEQKSNESEESLKNPLGHSRTQRPVCTDPILLTIKK